MFGFVCDEDFVDGNYGFCVWNVNLYVYEIVEFVGCFEVDVECVLFVVVWEVG